MSAFRIGKFVVVGTLGTGAHSTILHVRRRADGKNYALKVVPIGRGRKDDEDEDEEDERKYLEQVRLEFRVGQLLGHPNILKVYALEEVKDWLWRVRKAHLLTEYVNGKTLDACPRIPLPQLVQVFCKIASGMSQMHRRGVFHADLKPNNVMLSKAGEVKIIDFGLAWIKGEKKDRIQGTPEYMAPEQVKSKTVNEKTDIYNFGATMYRMVTWRHPPSTISVEDNGLPLDEHTFARAYKPVQKFNAKAPPVLCELIDLCLSYKPEDRPERMADVQEVLDTLAEELVTSPTDRLEAQEW